MIWITHGVVKYIITDRLSLDNLVLGRETLNELKAIVDFKNSTIDINIVILSMQSVSAREDPSMS